MSLLDSRAALGLIRVTRAHALTAALLTSVALNVTLSRELAATRVAPPPTIAPGTLLPAITGTTPEGAIQTIDYRSDRPTLLYYYRSECAWCRRNWTNVTTLASQATSFRVVLLSGDDGVPVRPEGLPEQVVVLGGIQRATIDAYKLVGTPQTMVVSADGRSIQTWAGAYQGNRLAEIGRFFGVSLPGLVPRESAGSGVTTPQQ